MFRIENNVPEVYVAESRDFQLVSRLYDLAINTTKYSITTLEEITNTKYCNSSILPLLCTKLGIFDDLQMSDKEYRVLLSVFPYVIRKKGSKEALDIICNAFSHIVNTHCECRIVDKTTTSDNDAIIYFEEYSPDVKLLLTLLDYVRPAGYKIGVQISTSIDLGNSSSAEKLQLINKYERTEFFDPSEISVVKSPDTTESNKLQSRVGFVTVIPTSEEALETEDIDEA